MQTYAPHSRLPRQPNQAGTIRYVLVFIILLSGIFVVFHSVKSHALSKVSEIKSGTANYCLDIYHDEHLANTTVDAAACNNTSAQDWTVTDGTITHDDSRCLSVENNGTKVGDSVILSSCDDSAGQVWLRDQSGFENPNSSLCLNDPSSQNGAHVNLASCTNLSSKYETWTPLTPSGAVAASPACSGTEGQKVACYAEKEWTTWQSANPNHETLLNSYTDGAPYEEWCADFVSYIYKEAGYPFTGGETDGWDENIADNIQNMGFVEHSVANYTPQPGDVAFFDYPGGHVEIVASGGKTPTYIYGDSATTDPTTGNGQMEANTISNDGSLGQVMYYLSPTQQ